MPFISFSPQYKHGRARFNSTDTFGGHPSFQCPEGDDDFLHKNRPSWRPHNFQSHRRQQSSSCTLPTTSEEEHLVAALDSVEPYTISQGNSLNLPAPRAKSKKWSRFGRQMSIALRREAGLSTSPTHSTSPISHRTPHVATSSSKHHPSISKDMISLPKGNHLMPRSVIIDSSGILDLHELEELGRFMEFSPAPAEQFKMNPSAKVGYGQLGTLMEILTARLSDVEVIILNCQIYTLEELGLITTMFSKFDRLHSIAVLDAQDDPPTYEKDSIKKILTGWSDACSTLKCADFGSGSRWIISSDSTGMLREWDEHFEFGHGLTVGVEAENTNILRISSLLSELPLIN